MQTLQSIRPLVDEPGREWYDAARFPGRIITVSREPGARGAEVARAVATRMGLAFYDREILTRMSAEARVAALGSQHLGQVVGAIAACGDAVILGRGAHLMVPPRLALRVLVQAPLPMRIAAVAAREGIDETAARYRVAEMERERRSFLACCFRADEGDPSQFDLRVNTGVLGVDATIAIICAAAAAMGVARQVHVAHLA